MKVKDLIEILEAMNPESEVIVPGGFTDYGTNDVNVFESYGQVHIQEK